jgi:hypothetical protein
VWEYFLSLRLLTENARKAGSSELARQQAALALIMSVTAVEVFVNLWFRIRVEGSGNPNHRLTLEEDLLKRRSLESKLKNWPKRYLGHELDLNNGPGQNFALIKKKRNAIVHFTSTHQTIQIGPVHFHGMADTTEYDTLTATDASNALQAAIQLVGEIFRLADIKDQELKGAMHSWTGTIDA